MAAAADVARLIVSLRLDDKGFSGRLNAAAGALNNFDRGLGQMGRGVGQLGSGLGRLATVGAAAAAGGLAAVVTTAASFEQAFTGVEKTVEGTDAQLAELEETLRGMARTMPVSFEEQAGIGEAGGALGIARDDLDEFVDVVARLAVSTDLSADQAATALGQLGNVLHLSGSDFEDFSDSLVALGNAGASTESQIVDIAARFGAAGNAAGLSKEEILALSSSVASMGIEVEAGGSSLSRLFNQTTTNIGVANAKAEAFAEALGLTFDEFKTAWDQDALGTFEDLLHHLNDLDQFEAASLLKRIGITGVRDINAIGLMAQNVGFVADQLEIAEGAQGALGVESGKFFATTQAQWKILQNNVRDSAAVIGTELLPMVNDLITDFVGFLGKGDTQSGLKDFAVDLADGVRGMVQEIKNADFGPLIETFKIAGGIAKAGFDAFRALPPGVQALALAAIGVNKLTGGALTEISKGMGNLLGGAIKLAIPALNRGQTPINPLFVKDVSGGLGGGPGGKGGGRGFPLLGVAGALAVPLTLSGSDNPNAEMNNRRIQLQKDVDQGLIDMAQAAERWTDAYGKSGENPFSITDRVNALNSALRQRPGNREGLGREHLDEQKLLRQRVELLPNTAMLTSQVSRITTPLTPLPSILSQVNAKNAEQVRKQGELLNAERAGLTTLSQIRDKRTTVNVNTTVNTRVNVAAGQVVAAVQTFRSATGGGAFLE